jgi:hypothetical protein
MKGAGESKMRGALAVLAGAVAVLADAACSSTPGGDPVGSSSAAIGGGDVCNLFANDITEEPADVAAALMADGYHVVGHVTIETPEGNYVVAAFGTTAPGNPLAGQYGFVPTSYFPDAIVCDTTTYVVQGTGGNGQPPQACTPPSAAPAGTAMPKSAGALRIESGAVAPSGAGTADDAGGACVPICGPNQICVLCCPNQ